MRKIVKRVLLAIAIILIIFFGYSFYRQSGVYSTYGENGTPAIELPINTGAKLPDLIMPMGETINHEAKYGGHPGIDFQWYDGDGVKIYASMDAEVVGIFESGREGLFDLATRNGKWGVDYTELESVNPELKAGSKIKAGDWVGIPNHPQDLAGEPKYRMIHWQFGYAEELFPGMIRKRLCPLNYFSPSAKSLIEKIWANTDWPEMKANAPEICSKYYKGRDK